MMRMRTILLSLLCFLALPAAAARADEIVTLDTRPGVTQSVAIVAPPNPVAIVVLFAGGQGKIPISQLKPGQWVAKGNFLIRSRYEFAKHGFLVAMPDVPSDLIGKTGLEGMRRSWEHATDIAVVIAHLRSRAALPVWLIGTSRGTESAAALALRLPALVQGMVLTSTIGVPNRGGFSVFELPLHRVAVPALVVAHKNDGCFVTPPALAKRIADTMTASPRREAKTFEGGLPPVDKDPCEALSEHGYYGIEKQVVAAIAQFIKQ